MALRKRWVPPVVCACGQVLGPMRAREGNKRCSACVRAFARSKPMRPPPEQKGFFEDQRPRRSSTVDGGKTAAAGSSRMPTPAPEPKRETEVERTARVAVALIEAKNKADADPIAAAFLRLRAQGVPMHEAMKRAEEETRPKGENTDGK